MRAHEVAIAIGGQQIGGWTEYSIETSMLTPADAFTLTRPVDRLAWNACALDSPVLVTIDAVPVLSGFVGEIEASASGGTMTVSGRCRVGRLVQESAPGIQYGSLKRSDLVGKLAAPWFPKVVLSNARDRKLRRGRGVQAPAPTEPLVIDNVSAGGRIEPGQARWKVIEELVTQAGYLAWGAADGKELVVGLPNYQQEVQWAFVHDADRPGTVLELTQSESIEDAFSQIQVVGSGRGTDADYGVGPSDRVGVVRDGPGPFGVGVDFLQAKRLVVVAQARTNEHAQRLARREAARRNQQRRRLQVEARGHGQIVRGARPTIFAPDTLARCIYDRTGLDAVYLVTSCKYQGSRSGGARTSLSLVPRGTELTL